MNVIYEIINKVFGTYYGKDVSYKHHLKIIRRGNPRFPKLRGLVELHEGNSESKNAEKLKYYVSSQRIRKMKKIMDTVDQWDEEKPNSANNLSLEFPKAAKRPIKLFPDSPFF